MSYLLLDFYDYVTTGKGVVIVFVLMSLFGSDVVVKRVC